MKACKVIIVVFVMFMGGCATYGERKYSEYMSYANVNLENKDYYDAVSNALTALRYDNKEEAKSLVGNYSANAYSQMSDKLTQLSYDADSYQKAKEIDEKTSSIAKDVKDFNPSGSEDGNFKKFKNSYDEYLNKLNDEINNKVSASLSKNDTDSAINTLNSYMKSDVPKNNKLTATVSKVIDALIAKNEIDKLIDLLDNNTKYMVTDKQTEVANLVNKYAAKIESKGDKKKALATYEKVLKLNESNAEALNAIERIKNEVMTIFSIADILNASDESINFHYTQIQSIIEPELSKKNRYIEFVQAKKFLTEEFLSDVEFDNLLQSKQVRFKVVKNIRYVISPKVTTIKINRSSPIIMTKTANWDFNVDGSAFLIGAQESLNYGGHVNHYEYTESTEKVTSSQKMEFIVFDTKTKKIVLKDRIDSRYEDSSTWAENPMAVGNINKTPASYFPSKIRGLMSNRHSAASDDECKNKMMIDAFEKITQKISEKLYAEAVN